MVESVDNQSSQNVQQGVRGRGPKGGQAMSTPGHEAGHVEGFLSCSHPAV